MVSQNLRSHVTEEYFMLPDNWLDLHTSHNEHGRNLALELETLSHFSANTPMQFFFLSDFLLGIQ